MAKSNYTVKYSTGVKVAKTKQVRIDGASLSRYLRENGVPIPEFAFSISLEKGERNTLVFEWTENSVEDFPR